MSDHLVCIMRCNICGEEWEDDGEVECLACGSDDYEVGEWRGEEEGPICARCKGPGQEPHPCPYQAALHKDHNPEYCTCCPACETRCRNDI